jgi:hypothetical protein
MAQGHLDTFLVGRRRYVLVESLRSLPTRLGTAAKKARR